MTTVSVGDLRVSYPEVLSKRSEFPGTPTRTLWFRDERRTVFCEISACEPDAERPELCDILSAAYERKGEQAETERIEGWTVMYQPTDPSSGAAGVNLLAAHQFVSVSMYVAPHLWDTSLGMWARKYQRAIAEGICRNNDASARPRPRAPEE